MGRLLFVQLVAVLLVSGLGIWFLAAAWSPVFNEAIQQLPKAGLIQNGQLDSPRTSTEPLAENRFLALVMNVPGGSVPIVSSDVRLEFRRWRVAVCSRLGCLALPYPKGTTVQFNQPELESWWGAWETMVYSITALAGVVGLFASWFILATLYCPIIRLYAFFKDRQLTVVGSWKLSAAALMPGELCIAAAFWLYGSGWIDFVRFLELWLLPLPLGWVYLFVSPLRLPRATDAPPGRGRNPFGSGKRRSRADT
jgi:hypothetical protein